MKLLDVISRASLIGIGCAILWVFSCIVRFGSHYVQEPNTIVLVLEVIFIVAMIILAIIILIRDMMRGNK